MQGIQIGASELPRRSAKAATKKAAPKYRRQMPAFFWGEKKSDSEVAALQSLAAILLRAAYGVAQEVC